MSNDISDKDKKDWDKFIKSNEKLPDKDLKSQKKKIFKTKENLPLVGSLVKIYTKNFEGHFTLLASIYEFADNFQ